MTINPDQTCSTLLFLLRYWGCTAYVAVGRTTWLIITSNYSCNIDANRHDGASLILMRAATAGKARGVSLSLA